MSKHQMIGIFMKFKFNNSKTTTNDLPLTSVSYQSCIRCTAHKDIYFPPERNMLKKITRWKPILKSLVGYIQMSMFRIYRVIAVCENELRGHFNILSL